jgi:hypothetical protein
MADEYLVIESEHHGDSGPKSGPNSVSPYAWFTITATIIFLITLLCMLIYQRRRQWRREMAMDVEKGDVASTPMIKPLPAPPPLEMRA